MRLKGGKVFIDISDTDLLDDDFSQVISEELAKEIISKGLVISLRFGTSKITKESVMDGINFVHDYIYYYYNPIRSWVDDEEPSYWYIYIKHQLSTNEYSLHVYEE